MPEEQAQNLHKTVAQLLFMCMIYCLYIQPLVDFLTTRVRPPDKYNWGNLKQGLNNLKGTLYMKLYLRANSLNTIHRWVGASYCTHWEFKRHTGETMSIGVCEILSLSRKQKLNTSSSTEAEFVGIANALGLMMCNKYFMEA